MLEFFFFIIGLLFGSFANVCILRLPKDEDIFFLKSKCFNCKERNSLEKQYTIIFLLKFSWCFRVLSKKNKLQYPIIELVMGLLFLIKSILFETSQALTLSLVFFVIILIIMIDYYHQIIFDVMNYILIVSGLLISFFYSELNPQNISFNNS